jgi:hypothetical protein
MSMTVCSDRCVPVRKFLNDASLGQCVPWMMRPLDDASLWRCLQTPDRIQALGNHASAKIKSLLWLPRVPCGPTRVTQASLIYSDTAAFGGHRLLQSWPTLYQHYIIPSLPVRDSSCGDTLSKRHIVQELSFVDWTLHFVAVCPESLSSIYRVQIK